MSAELDVLDRAALGVALAAAYAFAEDLERRLAAVDAQARRQALRVIQADTR